MPGGRKAPEAAGSGAPGTWRVLGTSKGAGHGPTAHLPSKDLKLLGLAPGDVVLLCAKAKRTVCACEASGKASSGELLLSAAALGSLEVKEGDEVTVLRDFEALEANELWVDAAALAAEWPRMAGKLQLLKYLKAVLEGALVVEGDLRLISLNGRAWEVAIRTCRGKEKDWPGPWLVVEKTQLRLGLEGTPALPHAGSLEASVGGLRQVVEELREAVQLPLQRPELYRQMGISAPKGVLLYGPPGTGKTLLAKSLAADLGCFCELLAATDLVGTGVGESEERIAAAFQNCRQQARERGTGALLFIDEIDAVCPKRDDASEVERRMVAAFLTALDGVSDSGEGSGLVVLGATNRPEALDPALRRSGRLEREIEVGVPNAEERLEILRVHLGFLQHHLSEAEERQLARRCHGFVGADLKALCGCAARGALRRQLPLDLDRFWEALRQVPPSALKELLVEVPEVRWDDIGGYESTKEALKEAVEWPIRHAWAFEAMGMEAPKGVLLYGPPGCSKTMMAKAVATETEMNFISVKGPELFSKYVGDSERSVREVFRKARQAAPCVIFFDEVDALGASRESEGGGVASRVLAQLLVEMDGVGGTRHVVVLAATNRPQALDSALTRPGRLDRLVHVPLPDEAARLAILQRQLGRMSADRSLAPQLAQSTAGYSGAEVVMVCREAALRAVREAVESADAPKAEAKHFEAALRAVQPRVTPEMAHFYADFERSMQRT
ncbi:unnamed protein product [Effrenium voratum]|uniref:AAA+ ATPase domain-containing protein n=1 Tax=Effrenium voratum TaxID=2562239 RepID=A0AA36MP53_9DINO|nr:unnamed protein product [Effrenium voratum]CAJ1380025.1 unnamed protein product [Effrenium voratum]CAJ1424535.1 unnamed protein product [Effrenium voratum]